MATNFQHNTWHCLLQLSWTWTCTWWVTLACSLICAHICVLYVYKQAMLSVRWHAYHTRTLVFTYGITWWINHDTGEQERDFASTTPFFFALHALILSVAGQIHQHIGVVSPCTSFSCSMYMNYDTVPRDLPSKSSYLCNLHGCAIYPRSRSSPSWTCPCSYSSHALRHYRPSSQRH